MARNTCALLLPPFRDGAERVLTGLRDVTVVRCPAPDGGSDSLFETASAAITRHGCTHVVATAERNMLLAGRLRDRHCLPGLNSVQALAVTDKRCVRLWAEPLVSMTRAWSAADVLADPSIVDGIAEFVVKPAVGSGTNGVTRQPRRRLLEQLRNGNGPRLVEEAVDLDRELYCDGYFADRRIVAMTVSAYSTPLLEARGKSHACTLLPAGHRWADPARSMVTTLIGNAPAADGVFHAEILVAGEQFYFGEMAMRPPAGGIADSLLFHRGIDIWEAFVRSQLGLPAVPVTGCPSPAWCGFVGVVSADDEAVGRRMAAMVARPGVIKLEHIPDGSARAGQSSGSFTWRLYFKVTSEADVAHLIEAASEAAAPSLVQ
jgi:hypothetical protein